MKVIDKPLRAFTRKPRVEGDIESQLPLTPLTRSGTFPQSEAVPSAKLTQAQDSDRLHVQDGPSSRDQLTEGEPKDPMTASQPRRRRRRPGIRDAAGASGLSTAVEVEGAGIDKSWIMQPQERTIRSDKSHSQRKQHLLKVLDPLMSEATSTLLLCRGGERHCHIIPVRIEDSADSITQWGLAHRAWKEQNVSWRSWLPRYGVQSVTVVTLQLAGIDPQSIKVANGLEKWIGIYRPEPTKAEIFGSKDTDSCLSTDAYECFFYTSDGTWNHDRDCPSISDEPGTCPHEDRLRAQKHLSRLQSRPFLDILFCHPALANGHETMDDQGFLISSRDLLFKLEQQHCPSLGDLSFPGLLIQEGWLLSHPRLQLAFFASSILFLSVITAWLVYGDWAVAWQVGGCFLALMTFICGCIHSAL